MVVLEIDSASSKVVAPIEVGVCAFILSITAIRYRLTDIIGN